MLDVSRQVAQHLRSKRYLLTREGDVTVDLPPRTHESLTLRCLCEHPERHQHAQTRGEWTGDVLFPKLSGKKLAFDPQLNPEDSQPQEQGGSSAVLCDPQDQYARLTCGAWFSYRPARC